jgi:hypothetical protein
MLKNETERGMRRWRAVALLTAGLAIGVTMMATPAASHVGGTVGHLWNDHIKPRADARYANAVPGTDKAKDADKVDGFDSSQLASFIGAFQGGSYSDECTAGVRPASSFFECAVVNLAVPAGQTYVVGIESSASFVETGGAANPVQMCTAVREATAAAGTGCVNVAQGVTVPAGSVWVAASANGVRTLSGGVSGTSYVVYTAVNPASAPMDVNFGFDNAVIHTSVLVSKERPLGLAAVGMGSVARR